MTDLVSPLVGAWFFEDVIAKLIPTRWCATPGCGFLSRGIWFERVLQKSMPVMATGLRASRPNNGSSSNETLNADPNIRGIGQQGHLPYLFLNSTWVESGERAIASEVRIKSESHKDFPTARDTIDIIGQDLTLGTAAHNSARFPFVNAIGAVFTAPEVSAEKTRDSKPILSGHVADGGYFDNSGSHTVIDILRKLRVILFDDAYVGTERSKKVHEWLKVRDWAREVIQPQIIFLHNGSLEPCQLKGGFHQPVRQFVSRRCEKERVSPPYLPEFPHDRGPLKLYSDMFGVPVTGFNATGLGANRFRADSLAISEIESIQRLLAPFQRRFAQPDPLAAFDQTRIRECNGRLVLYPLGWYLSSTARDGMKAQVCQILNLKHGLTDPGDSACCQSAKGGA